MKLLRTNNPDIEWSDGAPWSRRFGDIYFNPAEGLAESEHVFIDGNRLAERWQRVDRATFAIGELGFGSGLNLLAALRHWRGSVAAAQGQLLHFVSFERYPLDRTTLEAVLATQPAVADEARRLLAVYPRVRPAAGWHRMALDERVFLTLIVDDVNRALPQLDARIDAWFLDGFSPAKNPEMWQPTLFAALAERSRSGTTLATFSAAGRVRRALADRGFAMTSCSGFRRKREMLIGSYSGPDSNGPHREQRWLQRARPVLGDFVTSAPITIVGDGLAGALSADALRRRGCAVRVHGPAHRSPYGRAASACAAALSPRLTALPTPLGDLAWQGYLQSAQHYGAIDALSTSAGVSFAAYDQPTTARLLAVAERYAACEQVSAMLDRSDFADRVGVDCGVGGVHLSGIGAVDGTRLCQQLLDSPAIERLPPLSALDPELPTILCAGADSGDLLAGTSTVAMTRVNRGQLSIARASPASVQLKSVLCHKGYIAPSINGLHHLGASNDDRIDPKPSEADDVFNRSLLSQHLPHAEAALSLGGIIDRRVGHRLTTPDHLPLIGALPDEVAMREQLAWLARDHSRDRGGEMVWRRNLLVATAFGGKGLLAAPLAAELIADLITDAPLALPMSLLDAINPVRFLARAMIRGQ
ncbi:tRNA (5-methylaminomethyl-2-thiouridine)(34)-methyltransferase MnmD [Gammaproteobacteria bacterium]|nr:tRNA (5-methylaminomethyl-2-thiouridine)(34)-methyltransferase MnmD [Gammaproteobacteria bacterium]